MGSKVKITLGKARQGDKNTKYFHSSATKRYIKNLIEGVRDKDGVWRALPKDITTVLINYYKSFFSSSNQTMSQAILECLPCVITDEMNFFLSHDFDESEVTVALQQMVPLKASGPDGMAPLFYKHFWGTASEPRCHIIHFSMAKLWYLAFVLESYLYISHP